MEMRVAMRYTGPERRSTPNLRLLIDNAHRRHKKTIKLMARMLRESNPDGLMRLDRDINARKSTTVLDTKLLDLERVGNTVLRERFWKLNIYTVGQLMRLNETVPLSKIVAGNWVGKAKVKLLADRLRELGLDPWV